MIHVNRGTTSLGVFSEEEIREGLSAGRLGWTNACSRPMIVPSLARFVAEGQKPTRGNP